MSALCATVTGPWELHANANAVSATAKVSPPCPMACPLTMSAVTCIDTVARPGATVDQRHAQAPAGAVVVPHAPHVLRPVVARHPARVGDVLR